MNLFKKIRKLEPKHLSELAVLCGAAAFLLVAAVFVAGGGMNRISNLLAIHNVSLTSQTASVFPENNTSIPDLQLFLAPGQPSTVAPGASVIFVYNAGIYGANTFSPICFGSVDSNAECNLALSPAVWPLSGSTGNIDYYRPVNQGGFDGYYSAQGGNTPTGSGWPGGHIVLTAPATAGAYTFYLCSYWLAHAYGTQCATINLTVAASFTAPVWNSFTASSPVNSGAASTISWNITPGSVGSTGILNVVGGQYGAGTRVAGWSGSINTAALTTNTTYSMQIVDPTYGTFNSPNSQTVVVNAPATPPSGSISVCPPPNYTGCTNAVTITLGQQVFVGSTNSPGSGQALTATAIVQSVAAETNPDTNGSFLRCDVRNGCNAQSLGGYFTPPAVDQYTFYPTEADTNHAWGNWSNSSGVTVTVNPATFNYSIAVSNFTMVQGGSNAGSVTATLISGTSQTVSYAFSGLPIGMTISPAPSGCSTNNTVCSFTVNASAAVPANTYTITATATASGGLVKTRTFTVTVNPAATPTCTVTPASPSYSAGSTATINYTTSGSPASITIKDGATTLSPTPVVANSVSENGATVTTGTHTIVGTVQPGGATCTGSFTVSPSPLPTGSIIANPTSGTSPVNSVLNWSVSGANVSFATITGGTYGAYPGTQVVYPAFNVPTGALTNSTTYTLYAYDSVYAAYIAVSSATVTVSAAAACPVNCQAAGSTNAPNCIASSGYTYNPGNNTCTLNVLACPANCQAAGSTNAPNCIASSGYQYDAGSNTCSVIDVCTNLPFSGIQRSVPAGCTNTGGNTCGIPTGDIYNGSSCVVQPPQITTLSANPSRVRKGDNTAVTVTWTGTNLPLCSLSTLPSVAQSVLSNLASGGHATVGGSAGPITGKTQVTLTCGTQLLSVFITIVPVTQEL